MINKSPYNLIQSFRFALAGIYFALRHERNLRIHFAAGVVVVRISRYYETLTRGEFCLLLLLIGFVITCELINTAVEKTVDLETPVFHSLAKIAKDVAAGAVLVSSLTSIAVGLILFWDMDTIRFILSDIAARPWGWLFGAALALAWIILPQSPAVKQDK